MARTRCSKVSADRMAAVHQCKLALTYDPGAGAPVHAPEPMALLNVPSAIIYFDSE